VVGDSDNEPARMDNHLDRPEVATAIEGSRGAGTRYSPTLGKEMMYVAIALKKDSRTLGVLRTSIPVDNIDKALNAMQERIAVAGLIIAVFAAFLSLLLSKRFVGRSMKSERGGVFFAGEFDVHLPSSGLAEISDLSETMKRMAVN